jgi:hypothetical protein
MVLRYKKGSRSFFGLLGAFALPGALCGLNFWTQRAQRNHRERKVLLNNEQKVQECDATKDQ